MDTSTYNMSMMIIKLECIQRRSLKQ